MRWTILPESDCLGSKPISAGRADVPYRESGIAICHVHELNWAIATMFPCSLEGWVSTGDIDI